MDQVVQPAMVISNVASDKDPLILLTSSGTIFTNDANVFVAVVLTSSSWSLILPRIGTIKKITYGNALISSSWTMVLRDP